jgi:tail assembly chaperone E/41/14-like protein
MYKFKNPIKRGDALLEEVSVRPPALRDLKALDGVVGDTSRAIKMIELLTGLSTEDVERINLEDAAGLGELIARFFGNLPVGKTP